MGYLTELRFEMPVYKRSKSKHYEKYPDRDYSVNRAERRKRNKKQRVRRNEE